MDPARDAKLVENTPIDYLVLASPVSGQSSKVGMDESVSQRDEEMRDELGIMPATLARRVDPTLSTTDGSGLFLLHLIISCNSIR